MREEIDYARKIQLSMLPQAAPQLDWLDLAAASLPATEVGGDYYEYFQLGASQLVAGDRRRGRARPRQRPAALGGAELPLSAGEGPRLAGRGCSSG